MDSTSMQDELKRHGDIGAIGAALVLFAKSIYAGEFEKEGRGWIFRPCNFVTLQIQTRKPVIVLSLSGNYTFFMSKAKQSGLNEEWRNMDSGMAGYSTYRITSPSQLLPAAQFIKWASENYKLHGRRRARCS